MESSPQVDTRAIINGTPVTSEDIGLVKILSPNGCSGTLIAPNWVLTAQHCLAEEPSTTTVERTTTGEIRRAVQLVPWSQTGLNTDVGLIRVDPPFSVSAGADGYTNPLWPFAVTDLVGRTVECYGYGHDTVEGTGFGSLRHASLVVSSFLESSGQNVGVYVLARNELGQIQTYGDSGSGCFFTRDGQRYTVSVFANPGGDRAWAVPTARIRSWVDLQVHNDCHDGIQSGSESGVDCGGSCAACLPPATLSVTSEWESGWCGEIKLTNHAASQSLPWSVQFDIHESTLTTLYNAAYTNDGSLYTATGLPWNAKIGPVQSVSFGFCGNKLGANWRPELVSATVPVP
jgi:hypothetical protein